VEESSSSLDEDFLDFSNNTSEVIDLVNALSSFKTVDEKTTE
jgi:hypothetical protein